MMPPRCSHSLLVRLGAFLAMIFGPAVAMPQAPQVSQPPQAPSPEEAAKRMTVPPGFSVIAVAAEPMIRQPLSISFDNRGRLWVLQYLQYPNPAGLKPIKQDQYLRTVWDKVPEPPPHGPKGIDRITILDDRDERGVYRKSKDFLSDLNLASGFCLGHDGVYVLQSPYLLFYSDRDHDDRPDGPPEVLLSGFGFDDTHSVANSLQWGPDGWLYGAAGSTSTSRIKNPAQPSAPIIEFQQGIWRYHPKTRQFELFSEGGGNTFGLDFNKHGQAIAGTNYSNYAMLHQVQGGYYIKGFSKHGPLHNPHSYGYFHHVPYRNFKGGHVTCGGIVYQADAFPPEYRDQYLAGNLLANAIYWHKITPSGSTFTAEHGGDLVLANDPWFRPVDLFQGPDGCVYIVDWTDRRAAHLDPVDNWDKTNGRIFKLEYQGTPPFPKFDLTQKSSNQLVDLLKHPNKWWRNAARQLLCERYDPAVLPRLRQLIQSSDDLLALESLWALYVAGGWNEDFARETALNHRDEFVRAWAVRLLTDQPGSILAPATAAKLRTLAENEPSPVVRAQLACSAKRLPAAQGLPIATTLLTRSEDHADPFLPLLIWWAIEDKVADHAEAVVREMLARKETWATPLGQFVLERVARRLLADDTPRWSLAVTLLQAATESKQLTAVLRGIDLALQGRPNSGDLPANFLDVLRARKSHAPDDLARILIRLGDSTERQNLLNVVSDRKQPEAKRLAGLQLLTQVKAPELPPLLPTWLSEPSSDSWKLAVLAALEGIDDTATAERVLAAYPAWSPAVKRRAVAVLTSRPAWALALLRAVDANRFPKSELTLDQVRPAAEFNDPHVTKLIEKHWGKVGPATAGEKQARIAYLNLIMNRDGLGDPARGKVLFSKHCAACHQLFGEGGKVGPDLTTADRNNRQYLLTHIVDPSLYIRPEYLNYKINTVDGRTLTGLAKEQGESITVTTVVNNQVQAVVVPKADIEEMLPSPISLMPEKILDSISNDEIRDLFAYLMINPAGPPAGNPKSPPVATPGSGQSLAGENSKANNVVRVALISGSLEYKSDESLIKFQEFLESRYPMKCVRIFRKTDDDLPGLEALQKCDLAIFYTRRLTLRGEQLDRIKEYVASGKPILGLRTASHGFQNWLEMDRLVFGGNYQGHYQAGPICEVILADSGKNHPILTGVKPFQSPGSLYKNPGLADDVQVLLSGKIPGHVEPVAWVRERKFDGKTQRVVYTSLGYPDDFDRPEFQKFLVNAIHWCLNQPIPAEK